jgi:hypothetical protein
MTRILREYHAKSEQLQFYPIMLKKMTDEETKRISFKKIIGIITKVEVF